MRHRLHACTENDQGYCFICEGGLAWCQTCGGGEASLPKECPGVKMTKFQQDEVQGGRLDFRDGEWQCAGHVASASNQKICGRCGVHIDELRPEGED
jgi:hypothetical protein